MLPYLVVRLVRHVLLGDDGVLRGSLIIHRVRYLSELRILNHQGSETSRGFCIPTCKGRQESKVFNNVQDEMFYVSILGRQ